MLREEYLSQLREKLTQNNIQGIDAMIEFYGEAIDDRIEDGMSEEDAVAAMEDTDSIVKNAKLDKPIASLMADKVKEKHKEASSSGHGTLFTVLAIVGFPIWFPLLIAGGVIIFSFYAVIWSLVISAWAVAVSLVAAGIGGTVVGIVYMVCGHPLSGLAMLGMSLFSAGLGIFAFLACVGLTKGAAKLTARIALGIKSLFIKKEH